MSYLNEKVFEAHLVKACQLTTNKAMEKAIFQSQGKYKAKELARLGHPYSARNAGGWVPYNDPAKINMQSYNFVLSWRKNDPKRRGDEINSSVFNEAEYADILAKGKNTTIPRPLIQRIMPVVDYWFLRNVLNGFRDAITSMR